MSFSTGAIEMARRGKAAHNRKNGPRTKSGRLSRSGDAKKVQREKREAWLEMTEREALEVVIKQRMKAGIPEKIARDQKSGTVQGWLHATEQINKDQYHAAEWFLSVRNEYHAAIDSPGTIWNRDDTSNPSYDPDAYESYCKRVRARWGEIEKAIVDAAFEGGERKNVIGALDVLLVRQSVQGDLIGDLRIGLNAIHRLHTGEKKKQAA
jgi:hypothetical protein